MPRVPGCISAPASDTVKGGRQAMNDALGHEVRAFLKHETPSRQVLPRNCDLADKPLHSDAFSHLAGVF
jgi:hypothetical protein